MIEKGYNKIYSPMRFGSHFLPQKQGTINPIVAESLRHTQAIAVVTSRFRFNFGGDIRNVVLKNAINQRPELQSISLQRFSFFKTLDFGQDIGTREWMN